MTAAVLLVLVALLYRVVIGVAGMNEMQWLHNFSPFAAIALCGAIYFPRRIAILGPLAAFFVSDLILNAYYLKTPHVQSLVSARMIPEYLALALSAGMGLWLRKNPRLGLMLCASVAGSIAFYLITNTGDWLTEPRYAKTAAGWIQALTTGLWPYPSTLFFFRNTVASDLLFTLLFWVHDVATGETTGVGADIGAGDTSMKTLRILIGLAGIFITALVARSEQPAASPTPSPTKTRLLFNAYDDDPHKVKVENIHFQINTIDLGQRTEFLKLGEMIPNTPFKLTKFEYKTLDNLSTGRVEDISELTITNTRSGAKAVLVYQKVANVPIDGATKKVR